MKRKLLALTISIIGVIILFSIKACGGEKNNIALVDIEYGVEQTNPSKKINNILSNIEEKAEQTKPTKKTNNILVNVGYSEEHATEIMKALSKVLKNADKLKITRMTGNPETGVNVVICNIVTFTTEDGKLFHIGVNDPNRHYTETYTLKGFPGVTVEIS